MEIEHMHQEKLNLMQELYDLIDKYNTCINCSDMVSVFCFVTTSLVFQTCTDKDKSLDILIDLIEQCMVIIKNKYELSEL